MNNIEKQGFEKHEPTSNVIIEAYQKDNLGLEFTSGGSYIWCIGDQAIYVTPATHKAITDRLKSIERKLKNGQV